jgi:glycosyltransferase involved in cell wall biosynthesis
VWKRYFPNIEEIYSIADVYIFPLFEEQNSIEIPLSVLEAMSCNLPVITTRYGGLERLFKAGEGLFYVNTIEEIVNVLEEISSAKIYVNTRSKVKSLSWNKVSREISTLYSGIMNNRKS